MELLKSDRVVYETKTTPQEPMGCQLAQVTKSLGFQVWSIFSICPCRSWHSTIMRTALQCCQRLTYCGLIWSEERPMLKALANVILSVTPPTPSLSYPERAAGKFTSIEQLLREKPTRPLFMSSRTPKTSPTKERGRPLPQQHELEKPQDVQWQRCASVGPGHNF